MSGNTDEWLETQYELSLRNALGKETPHSELSPDVREALDTMAHYAEQQKLPRLTPRGPRLSMPPSRPTTRNANFLRAFRFFFVPLQTVKAAWPHRHKPTTQYV